MAAEQSDLMGPPPAGVWSDRFVQPELDVLLDAIDGAKLPAVREFLDRTLEHFEAKARVSWRGLPWRWTVEIVVPGEDEPIAFVVCNPVRPGVAVSVRLTTLETVQASDLSAAARDAVTHAPAVGDRLWIELDATANATLGDVRALARPSS
ncbi:MAG: hypothetical protein AAFR38_04240 [Planctomycetota bacterium]